MTPELARSQPASSGSGVSGNCTSLPTESIDLSAQDGPDAAFATRLPNSAGFFATAFELDAASGEATGSPYFLAYDYPNPAGAGAEWQYRLYRIDGDTASGHDMVSVMTIPSAGQYLYFASEFIADYVPAIPGNEALITGYFLGDYDADPSTPDTVAAGIKAVNLALGMVVDIQAGGAMFLSTGAYPSQVSAAIDHNGDGTPDDLFYFYANPDATDGSGNTGETAVYDATDNTYDLHSLGADGAAMLQGAPVSAASLWSGQVAIQKNNKMIGHPSPNLLFMSSGGLVIVAADGAGGYAVMENPLVQGYIIGFKGDASGIFIGANTDYHLGGQNPGSLLMMGLDGSVVQANTNGPNGVAAPLGGFFTYGTVLNSYSDYVYFNAIDPVTGSMDVYSYSVDDDDVTSQGFEARTGIQIDPTSVNFGSYSGVVGAFRAGYNTNGELIFQLILMNPDIGLNLAFWSDQVDLLSNLAAVLGTGYSDPQFNAGFYTQYVHDLGWGSGKVLTTNIDNAGNMDPGLIDLMAMLLSMQSAASTGEATTDAACIVFQESVEGGGDDSVWSGTETLTAYENGVDLCGAYSGSPCDIEVLVFYKGKVVAGSGGVEIL